MGLAMGMEHAVEAALRADLDAPIGQGRQDLPGRQRRELRLVAGEQDPLALLLREAVRHQTVTALTAIDAVPITRVLSPPALQGGEPHSQEPGQLSGPCPGGQGGIEDLQSLAAISRRGQSPASSPFAPRWNIRSG